MFYHLAIFLKPSLSSFNMVHYISFRSISAMITALFLSFLFGKWFIQRSNQFFKSLAREHTPENHKAKANTPTMGGIFIIANVVISALLWCDLTNLKVWIAIACILLFGFIGSIDDYRKIKKQGGISAKKKFIYQISCALIIVLAWFIFVQPETTLCIPFFKNLNPNLGWLLIPWAIFIIVGCSNAVNLTDGLDGLAISSLITNFITFTTISYLAGHSKIAAYLHIPFAQTSEIAVFGSALVGACLGFLWYNTYPAQIFMGDVGSLSLGAILALMALMTKQEILLIISGGLFVAETFSVILQVIYFKLTGKRLFRMAPIHHHFELLGWKESTITVRCGIISIILALLALITLKIR